MSTIKSFSMRDHHRVLVSISGGSPQVLTETLYALARRKYPFVPDEIRVFTTRVGRDAMQRTLFEEGRFAALLDTIGVAPDSIEFGPEKIEVYLGADERELDDLRTEEDNTAAADQLVRAIARLTADDSTAVHASLAGGRRTMSYYLGKAMSLFGRPQDRLSHVLVNDPFESNPHFFFPPRDPVDIPDGKGGVLSTLEARIELSEIPFLHLGQSIEKPMREILLDPKFSFSDAVGWAQRAADTPRVQVSLARRQILLGTEDPVELRLSPNDFAFYVWLLRRHQKGMRYWNVHDADWRDVAAIQAHKMKQDVGIDPLAMNEGRPDNFNNPIHRVGQALLKQLGPWAASQYALIARRNLGAKRRDEGPPRRSGDYVLDGIPAENIIFEDWDEGDDHED